MPVIYELCTYWAVDGKLGLLHARFQDIVLPLFKRHDIQVIGFWTPESSTADSGNLVYILVFPDQLALQDAWTAFRADSDWQTGKAASETEGPIVAKRTSVILHPTAYSPLS